MALRFRRTIKIAPGVRLNIGKRGASVRVGPRGFGLTAGTSGTRVSAGIPGTGLSVTEKIDMPKASGVPKPRSKPAEPSVATEVTLRQLAAATNGIEPGTQFPGWWLTGAIVWALVATTGAWYAFWLAAWCFLMVSLRLGSAKYRAVAAIKKAAGSPSESSDEAVVGAAESAPTSWATQRDAGLYFYDRDRASLTARYLARAAKLVPGDRLPLLTLAVQASIDGGQFDAAIARVEPVVASLDADENDLRAVLLGFLALALHSKGEHERALEVLERLPLRRKDLEMPLLMGLSVRALARQALGQTDEAKHDLDRLYAADPTFAMIPEVEAALAGEGEGA